MRKQNISRLLALLLLVVTSVAVFYIIRANKLQNELEFSNTRQAQIESDIAEQQELMRIDSLLLKGNYNSALGAYQDRYEAADEQEQTGVELRMALARKFVELKSEFQLTGLKNAALQERDSSQIAEVPTPEEVDRYDSLSFAFEKAKVQMANLKRQLREKSLGEYLTFTSSKGSKMHYVGQVKNHRAHGFGVAILNTGSRYEGEWKNNQRHGEGSFYWPDGEYYVGNYVNDKRNGAGTYYWPNGEKYTGHWKDDKRSGEGIFYGKNGKIVANGIWKDDKLADSGKSSGR